jgi:hypothetical protein
MRSKVFKQVCTGAVESQKVPLEIFFNPTLLSDDDLFSQFPDFFTLLSMKGGILFLLPFLKPACPALGRDR